jgi:hypothetical protein
MLEFVILKINRLLLEEKLPPQEDNIIIKNKNGMNFI